MTRVGSTAIPHRQRARCRRRAHDLAARVREREHDSSRFVFIILRGALDGLTAVPPYGDPDYARPAREIAVPAPGSADGAITLDDLFGLHPSLRFCARCYAARELVVFHAVASPYRERSHFDGQDVLENGFVRPHASQTGWLNRALAAVPGALRRARSWASRWARTCRWSCAAPRQWRHGRLEARRARRRHARSASPTCTRAIRCSPAPCRCARQRTPSPAKRRTTTRTPMRRCSAPRWHRCQLGAAAARRAHDSSQALAKREQGKAAAGARYTEVIRAAAGFLRRDDGPQIAVFDATGWDTHANEGGAQGQLARDWARSMRACER